MSHRSSPLIALLALVFVVTSSVSADKVPLYGRFEQSFEAENHAKPFSSFHVEFTSPSGQKIVREGFYDGGSTYRIRFMPLEAGEWRYRADSDAPGLDGKAGTFQCGKTRGGNRFLTHGPIRVSKSGTHLEHLDGTPFFFLADTVWNGPLLSKKDHWDTFIDDRVSKHFTGIQFVSGPGRQGLGAGAEAVMASRKSEESA